MTINITNEEQLTAELKAIANAINEESRLRPAAEISASQRKKVHEALSEKISEILPSSAGTAATPAMATATPPPAVQKPKTGAKSYLDTVDDATVALVNQYVAKVFTHGLSATIKEVVESDPFVLDVFHDALSDKFYEELKIRRLIK